MSRAALLLLAFVAAAAPAAAQGANRPPVTFNRDIAPIVWAHCTPCHRPGQIAPFNLIEYRDVARRGRQIAAVTANGTMPPWLPEPGHGDFAAARRLSAHEVALIESWIKAGAPEGDPAERRSPPTFGAGWRLGKPDLVVEAPQPYLLPPGADDVFRNLVLQVPLGTSRYVRGIDVDPGNPRVVHHISLAVDPTPASRRLDAADPQPGFGGGMFADSAQSPESRALGWTPGMTPAFEPPGMAWQLQKGSDLVLFMHLMPLRSGEPQVVRPRVAPYFTDTPPARTPIDFKLGSKSIDIPAGVAAYAVEDRFTLPVDVQLLSIYPHAHYLAKEMRVTAARPDGTTSDLLWIRDWDFHWQDQYRYQPPPALPRGTTIVMRYVYDNSAANRHNPRPSPTRVRFGPQSSDEMGDLWLRLLPATIADANTLARAYRDHELTTDIALGEQNVAAAPQDAQWHSRLGASYLEAGRVADATRELQEALRLAPDQADAHNNLGSLLQRQGNIDEALPHFEAALGLEPDSDLVQLNLANALDAAGLTAEAIPHFERAIAINPAAAEAYNNLGVALGSLGRVEEAIARFRAALEIKPDYDDARKNLELALSLRR
jgi:tetratricopeptide (TPR) repeat protein